MATERHNNKKGFLEIWASSQDQDFGHPHHKNRPMPREKGMALEGGASEQLYQYVAISIE